MTVGTINRTGFGRRLRRMRILMSSRFVLMLCGALALLSLPAPVQAVDWLVLVVDRSNSIDADELHLQRQAYVDVLNDGKIVRALKDTAVAIVEFDSTATIIVPWTTAPDAAARYAAAMTAPGTRGGTGIGHGLGAALALLNEKQGRRVIDVSGDGQENRDSVLLERRRAAATASGIEINGLVISGRTQYDLKRYYKQKVVNGFVIEIDDVADFHAALKRKILQESLVSELNDADRLRAATDTDPR